MTIKIDKDVPLPEGAARSTIYPFEDMEVGDSFFVEGKTSDQLTNAASHWRKKNGWGFSARNVTESVTSFDEKGNTKTQEAKGARIWRTK